MIQPSPNDLRVVFERDYWNGAATDPDVDSRFICDRDTFACVAALGMDSAPWAGGGHARILDLGCGVGRLSLVLAARYPDAEFLGVDVSRLMIAEAVSRARDTSNVQWALGDGRTLGPLGETEWFDTAFSVAMFQHIPPDAVLGYLRAVFARLLPGGTFRVQFVDDAEPGPMSFGYDTDDVCGWAMDCGYQIGEVNTGLVADNWVWLTLLRP